jgi:hypothetical protein
MSGPIVFVQLSHEPPQQDPVLFQPCVLSRRLPRSARAPGGDIKVTIYSAQLYYTLMAGFDFHVARA